jgi:hypothetical protein
VRAEQPRHTVAIVELVAIHRDHRGGVREQSRGWALVPCEQGHTGTTELQDVPLLYGSPRMVAAEGTLAEALEASACATSSEASEHLLKTPMRLWFTMGCPLPAEEMERVCALTLTLTLTLSGGDGAGLCPHRARGRVWHAAADRGDPPGEYALDAQVGPEQPLHTLSAGCLCPYPPALWNPDPQW